MIRQGRLPEAQQVKTFEGRMWAVPLEAIPVIAERLDMDISVVDAIDVREPEAAEPVSDWQERSAEAATALSDHPETSEVGTAIEAAGSESGAGNGPGAPHELTLTEVLDTALLERLLGAKEAETGALVKAERQRTEYESLAARQLEVERRFDREVERSSELTRQLRDEAVARSIADARVTQLRDQLQREMAYAEAERYERRQAMAREALAAAEAAESRAAMGWWSRRRLRASGKQ
jgi:hypothetical protein